MYTLIFCQANDIVAHALHDALFQKGERNLRLVSDMELVFASWLHEADSDAVFFTRIKLNDGFIIEPFMIKSVVNRIPYFQLLHFIKQADRLYAEMEMYALYISFLRSIKEKVIDGMPVSHINTSDNTLFFYAMAIKAGMEVLDNHFTSSPRWKQQKSLTALAPQKKQTALWHKRSPHLVWENKPVLCNEPFASLVKVEIVGDKHFCSVVPGKQFSKKTAAFSQLMGRTVYELTLAETKGKFKLYAVDTRPKILSAPAIEAFAALLT
jgi:hypothetical protein